MKVHNIIAIIGPSGSGKTTLSLQLQKVGIPSIVSYTTRPMREGEQNGIDHHFVTPEAAAQLLDVHRELAKTIYGGHLYFALFNQVPDTPICTYVIDEAGLQNMVQNIRDFESLRDNLGIYDDFGKFKVYTVWLNRPDTSGIDLARMQRDAVRQRLPIPSYHIQVENDAADASEFRSWCIASSVSLFVTLAQDSLSPCSLRTSNNSVEYILSLLRGKASVESAAEFPEHHQSANQNE